MNDVMTRNVVNGIDLDALGEVVETIKRDPGEGMVRFNVTTRWTGQTGTVSKMGDIELGGERIARDFEVRADEPEQLLGQNQAPNPQELLMSAANACMTVGYVAGAAMHGITLDKLEIETSGQLDLRGFLGLDPSVPPGYDQIDYVVRIAGNGTREQFEEIHRAVMATSPNYYNLARPIRMNGTLAVG
ncbi:putative OsmC-like protein [Sphingomonas naasensis]|nr:OsmC family protein [Sphingomonas naasensis]NIJ19529.1 putative OsmC-like protein [Sphingomonas naasensis]